LNERLIEERKKKNSIITIYCGYRKKEMANEAGYREGLERELNKSNLSRK
jgi:hypothetical protein